MVKGASSLPSLKERVEAVLDADAFEPFDAFCRLTHCKTLKMVFNAVKIVPEQDNFSVKLVRFLICREKVCLGILGILGL